MSGASVLVVDDELGIRSTINEILSDEGYAVSTAADAGEARRHYSTAHPDLVLLDIWMPDIDGISLLKQWSEDGGLKCPVVVMSGHGTVETAVEATRLGAFDYIEKPLSLAQLLRTVEAALTRRAEHAPSAPARSGRAAAPETPQGNSPVIKAARDEAVNIANQRAPALITGEPGSGRDLFARLIHESGSRSAGPFVVVHGAELGDETALEQLVGKVTEHGVEPGLLDAASGGTLFISDLQTLGPRAQSLLVGLIEQGGYARPGRATREPMDVRFLASIQHGVAENLRPDVIAAMGVMQLRVPPLRDYSEDIPRLLEHYVDAGIEQQGLGYRHFSVAAQNRLRNYPWPGNLRELKSLVLRLLLAGGAEEISLDEIDRALIPQTDNVEPLVKQDLLALPMREAREQFERAYLEQQLALCGGKVGKLAERVGMERTHLYRKLRSLGVEFRQG